MRLMITGAGGMLGQDVARAAQRAGHDVIAVTRAQLDITDAQAVQAAMASAQPQAVINCAAYTNVDGAESDVETAARVNAQGAGNVAQTAHDAGARTVHVSTDYVFDGDKGSPYIEDDAPAPRSVYGQTKLDGERAVAQVAPDRSAIVRSSWLFGAGGKNFVDTMLRLGAERDEVSVVTDQVGCPTWTGHLAQALVELAQTGGPGIHHVAGVGACSWNELATEAFRLTETPCRVLPATTAQMARPAPRPVCSALQATRSDTPRLPRWQDGLAGYLAERGAGGGAGADGAAGSTPAHSQALTP